MNLLNGRGKMKRANRIARAGIRVVAGLMGAGAGMAVSAFAAAPTPGTSLRFNSAAVSPNKLNAAQAQATILSDSDPFWEKAEKTYPPGSPCPPFRTRA